MSTSTTPLSSMSSTSTIAFKAVNDSVRLNGLVLILLVYSVYLCISELDIPALTVSQRAMTIKKAMEEISKIRAKRQVQDVINMHNNLDSRKYRPKWKLRRVIQAYKSTIVKPYLTLTEGIDGIKLPEPELGTTADEEHQEEPNKSTITVTLPPVPSVKRRRLLEKGVFEIANPQSMLNDICIFNTRFVDEIKNKETEKAFEKSRLVVQAYKDNEKKLVLT
ncbi:hypothetical protein B7463_g539, partial [Scytalidium lignicola]